MIKYTLQCSNGHRFDAWFGSSSSCDEQIDAGFVGCATCGDVAVQKAPMAPAITGSQKRTTAKDRSQDFGPESPAAVPSAPPTGEMATAGQVREALHMLRRFVESNADYVGDRFADEARKIHSGDAEERGIYGETTPEEAEALEEEGVPFGRVPWIQNDT
jgi:hypothetical protein